MIEIVRSGADSYEGHIIVDGVILPVVKAYESSVGGNWSIRFSADSGGGVLLQQHFSDLPKTLSSLIVSNVSQSPRDTLFVDNFRVERNVAGAVFVSITRSFRTNLWKHPWSIQEYMDEFRRMVERERRFEASWDERWMASISSPFFVVLFSLKDIDAVIGEEISRRENDMLELHALTEASLESKLGYTDAERIVRSIEFPPEYHRSGITILSYFADVLRHKNLSEEVKVSIEQNGLTVTLVIESPTGQRELIERVLETYALVVTGKQPVDTLTTDPYEMAELKSQLRLASAQIENQRDLLALKSSEAEETKASLKRLEARADEDRARLMTLIEGLVAHNAGLASGLRELNEQALKLHNEALAAALDNLSRMIERGVREEDREEVIRNLSTIRREDPGVFKRVFDILGSGAMSNAAGNYLYSWLQFFVGTLPK